jgi:dephospho-CoA kinase
MAGRMLDDDPVVRRKVIRAFGPLTYDNFGKPDRATISRIVFTNRRNLAKLNEIIHPRVISLLGKRINSLTIRKRCPYVIVEAALIFEAGIQNLFDFIIHVDTPLDIRLKRAARAGKFSRRDFVRRRRSQMGDREKRRKSDFVIVNKGPVRELRTAVRLIDQFLQTAHFSEN